VCIVYHPIRTAKFSKWRSQISGIEENTIKDVDMISLSNFTSLLLLGSVPAFPAPGPTTRTTRSGSISIIDVDSESGGGNHT
jgi:hypothetical protein